MVQGQRLKDQGHSVRNSQHRFTSIMSRFVTYLPRQCVEHPPQRACALRIVGVSAPHGGCQAHFAKRPKTIFSNQTSPRNPERLAQCRSAFEMQCFCNCTLSSLLLTRGVALRDLHLWLPHGVSQNAIFSNEKTENADNMPYRLAQVGVAFELQCLRNCTLSSSFFFCCICLYLFTATRYV